MLSKRMQWFGIWMHFNDMKQFELTLLGTNSIVAATILLSSTGGAAEWQGNALGEFVEAGEHGGRPYYRQRDTEGKADNFLYSEGGKWWVHDSMGKSVGKLSNPQNSPEPPTSGWVYFADQEYRDDDDSLTLELNVLNPPPYHTIRGEGAMVYKVGSSLGKYRFAYISGKEIEKYATGWSWERGARVDRCSRKLEERRGFCSSRREGLNGT